VQGLLHSPGLVGRVDSVPLDTLDAEALLQVSSSFLDHDAPRLAALLESRTGGLPVAVAQWISLLCDEGRLVQVEPSQWRLVQESDQSQDAELERVILRRMQYLSDAVRRLLTLASVAGQTFDLAVLREAAREHPRIVDTAMEELITAWFIRPYSDHWYASRLERDLEMWSRGGRTGRFEFVHKRVRSVLYEQINPIRRAHLHDQVGRAMEELAGSNPNTACESIATHLRAGNEGSRAIPWLIRSARKALRLGAVDSAETYATEASNLVGLAAPASVDEETRDRLEGCLHELRQARAVLRDPTLLVSE